MGIALGRYVVEAATGFGPRVTGLRLDDGPEVFAVLSPDVVVGSGDDPYRFMGGHRVWASPEIPEITYAPDQHECTVEETEGSLTISAGPDRAGIVKEISVTAGERSLEVVHRLRFTRDLGYRLAPWAITQLPLGGQAIIPLLGDPTGPRPNRNLVLWPYTSLSDPRLSLTDEFALVDGSGEVPVKLGAGPSPGHLGYWRENLLFMKTVEAAGDREIPDMGANAQVFVGSGFCELESVGAMVAATQGTVATVTESWSILECADLDTAVAVTLEGLTP